MSARQAETLASRVRKFPDAPGVYLFRGADGKVLYVGKALSLRKRVASYLGERRGRDAKTMVLMRQVADAEYILAGSEREAFLLEESLIKRHQPRYNILLRDDKTYPFLRLTVEDSYPRILVERRPSHPESLYYGPYPNIRLREILNLLRRHFGICDCHKPQDGKSRKACLRFSLGQCSGPCVGAVSSGDYARHVRQVRQFLEGRHDPLSGEVRIAMEKASEEQAYEEAARLRDLLASLAGMGKGATVVTTEKVDVDAVALAAGMGKAVAVVLQMRQGRVVGSVRRTLENEMEEPLPEVLAHFLEQHYVPGVHLPGEMVLPRGMAPPARWVEWVRERLGGRFVVRKAHRGWRRRLMDLAAQNAMDAVREEASRKAVLEGLGKALGMKRLPRTIACFDVSTLQGSQTVGSAVLFKDGLPEKGRYRKFRMRTVSGPDDYASHREMMSRYLRLVAREGNALPDLFLIDGGWGQLQAVRPFLEDFLAAGHGLAALAKKEEEVFTVGKDGPVRLKAAEKWLLMRARDEAHRFAHGYHRLLRDRDTLSSSLREVPGLGKTRMAALLRRFGSVKGIQDAPNGQIAAIKGFSPDLESRIRAHLVSGLNEEKPL